MNRATLPRLLLAFSIYVASYGVLRRSIAVGGEDGAPLRLVFPPGSVFLWVAYRPLTLVDELVNGAIVEAEPGVSEPASS